MLDHFDTLRQKRVLLIAGILAFAMVFLAIASVVEQKGALSPGFVLWRNLVVPAVSSNRFPGPDVSLPYRSVLMAVDGHEVHSVADVQAILRQAPPGTAFRYTFVHDQQVEERTIRSRRLGWSTLLELVGPYVLNGIVLLVTALVVFFFKPGLPAARAFLALALTFGGMLLLAVDAFFSFRADRLCFTLDSLVPAALLHFGLCFPEPKAIVRRHPWLEWAPYLACLPLAVAQSYFLTRSAAGHLRTSDLVYAADAAAALLAVLALIHTFVRSQNPLARQQAKAVAAGFALSSFIPALAILSVVVFRADLPFNPLSVFLIVCPLSIGYAIARHNLFAVDRFLRTGVVYGALTLIVFLVYAAIVLTGEQLVAERQPLAGALMPFYLLVVLFIAEPLRRRIQLVVDRLLYRQSYSFRTTVESSSAALASMLQSEGIAHQVLGALTGALALDWAALVVRRQDGELQTFAEPNEPAQRLEQRIRAQAAGVGELIAASSIVTRLDRSPRRRGRVAALASLDAILSVPVRTTKADLGLLLLSEKKSGAFYSDEDLDLLQTLANQAALALTNAEAYEALQRAQDELVQAERLAAVGELSATVAHGIRNPLAGIRMAAQIARDEREDIEAVTESLDDIISESDRLEQRVRAILDLARPGGPTESQTNVEATLSRFVEMMRQRLPAGTEIVVRCEAGLPLVRFESNQLIEVVEIVVNNAVEAMKGPGRIELRAARRAGATSSEERVRLEIEDNGPGINDTTLGRIFELFYTTKGTGTGVGLAMARRLIERQQGSIDVRSTVGSGTTFLIELKPVS